MPLTNWEILGVSDLLLKQEENVIILLPLAKSITKNLTNIDSAQEALEYISIHIEDSSTLLSKKAITKEILFKYLHKKQIPVNVDFTKINLVKKVTSYWVKQFKQSSEIKEVAVVEESLPCAGIAQLEVAVESHRVEETTQIFSSPPVVAECEYPIHLLARKFAEWFFDLYNKDSLKIEDFWSDVRLLLKISANEGCNLQECQDSDSMISVLSDVKNQFRFIYSPNLSYFGVQGRMDSHGLVLVLACGTLHTPKECVGVFECMFGLLRDPFANHNWKAKNIQLWLRSKPVSNKPSLEESESLREVFLLPIPQLPEAELT